MLRPANLLASLLLALAITPVLVNQAVGQTAPTAETKASETKASQAKAADSKASETKTSRWEPSIQKFEAADKKSPPQTGGIVFVGSSSIVGWDTKKWFPTLPVINRGFGGSQLADSVEFADRIVTPYQPKVVVLYAGDNDIASKKKPTQIADDFKKFVAKVHADCPEAKIVYLSVKLCESRWKNKELVDETNRLITAQCQASEQLTFVDLATVLIGSNGMPENKYFKKDLLHLNEEGYAVWTKTLTPVLEQLLAAPTSAASASK